ncbi:MAG: ABC transporter ATP-binding protein [Bacilli bacterium]|nr:ABC transporter ATP-binding protein [Bacilli bacterium]
MKLFKEVIKNNLKLMIIYVILGITFTFLGLYATNYFQVIIDSFGTNTTTISMIIFYGIILLVTAIIGYIDNYPDRKLFNKLYLEFKKQSMKKLKTIDYQEYVKIGTGRLSQQVEEGATSARDALYYFWLKLLRELLPGALISLIFIGKIEIKILYAVLVGYIFVIILTNIVLKILYDLKEKIIINQELLNKHLIRGFMELVIFRTNKKYDTELSKIDEEITDITKGRTKIKLVHEIFFTAFEILVAIIKIIMLVYAVISKNLTIGEIVVLITLLGKAYEPIAIFNVEYIDYKLNKVSLKRYIEYLDLKDVENMYEGKELKKVTGNIKIQDVSFAYKEKQVLTNINLDIKEKTKVAFVGETGSGKSTIIKLIAGLIKPQSGKIQLDGVDLNKIKLDSYYEHLSYLSQDSPIFDGTLKENIVFDKDISDEKIIEVLKLVELEKFYSKLKNGLQTELGEKGILISGGERQRIALARLFFDDSKIIILDEATSAMDNITEEKVMENIMEKLDNRTFIIIAHRLNTIKNVDEIFVLRNGEIIESGTYKKLQKTSEYFQELSLKKK